MAGLDKTIELSKLLSGMNNPGVPGNPGNPGRGSVPVSNQAPVRKVTYAKPPGYIGNSNNNNVSVQPKNSNQPKEVEPPTGDHDLKEIDQWWANFLGFMRAKSMMQWSQISRLTLEGTEDSAVLLGYTDGTKPLKDLLSKSKKAVCEHLSEFCGNETSITFVKANNIGKSTPNNGGLKSLDSAKEFLDNHPKIKKVNDLIDGDIIGYKGSN